MMQQVAAQNTDSAALPFATSKPAKAVEAGISAESRSQNNQAFQQAFDDALHSKVSNRIKHIYFIRAGLGDPAITCESMSRFLRDFPEDPFISDENQQEYIAIISDAHDSHLCRGGNGRPRSRSDS